ncbi:MAG: glycosyltransferase family 2 protein [Candidatus Euphemobacter frigidus]|nr:glycosyltransferase family 2 protein [Candidatus Euphemobacter frigidus]MDP8275130.1 glycosyltransferase family 2 protein [Candidatus Euphemobacter frigidus]
MKTTEVTYSMIIPVYNAEKTLEELISRIKQAFSSLDVTYEIILIDDNSRDNSWEVIKRLKRGSPNLRIIRLRRNFGQHNAIMCGLHFFRGDYVITIDDDLQIPPEEIPKLIAGAAEGYDVVYGIYDRKKHNLLKNFGSFLIGCYYRKIFHMSNQVSAFRIIKREIAREIINYDKTFPYIDGLISWNTGNIGEVPVKHYRRGAGISGYSIGKMVKLAFDMVTNFSAFPIRVASLLGVLFSLVGFLLALYFFFRFGLGMPVTGYASMLVAVTIFSGVQLLTIGIIGEYIARVHMNINRKPQYVIKDQDI